MNLLPRTSLSLILPRNLTSLQKVSLTSGKKLRVHSERSGSLLVSRSEKAFNSACSLATSTKSTGPRHRLVRTRPRRPREERWEEGLRGVGGPVRRRPLSSLQGAGQAFHFTYRVKRVSLPEGFWIKYCSRASITARGQDIEVTIKASIYSPLYRICRGVTRTLHSSPSVTRWAA